MPPRITIRPPASRDEALQFGWCLYHSLAATPQPTLDLVESFVERTGVSRIRVAVRGREVLGGLVLLDMGQFFGGRSVPMTGVGAVAVHAEHRGGGVGRALMTSALREMASRGIALSGLYPATQPIYRRLGWEIAGVRQQWRVPTRSLALGERSPAVRRLLTEDRAALHDCYFQWARRRAGLLDRIDWGWQRVLESPEVEVRAHVVEAPRGRGLEGYVVAVRQPLSGLRNEMVVRDLVALTPRALPRLLSFLGDHRSIAPTTLLWMGPGDAAWMLPAEAEREVVTDWRWMTRIVDVKRAMEARGFAPALRVEVAVELEDAALPRHAGRWTIGCAEGHGFARRSAKAKPLVTLDVRALAALFTGHSSAHEVALAGLASGSEAALDALTSLFAGPAPWTPDMW